MLISGANVLKARESHSSRQNKTVLQLQNNTIDLCILSQLTILFRRVANWLL
jgi:hypothetical protein